MTRAWDGPLIASSWGFDLLQEVDSDPGREAAARIVLERADLLFVDNDASARRAHQLGMNSAQIAQFPWGLDERWFKTREDPPLNNPADVVVLSTRRHEELYRVGDVVESFVVAAKSHDNIRLKVIGSGSLTPQLKAHAAASAAADRIEFVGDVDNAFLPEFYRDTDIYVTASEVDGTSVSLLEAMASEAIVVASRNEGNTQWVSEKTGYGFAVGDSTALSETFVELASMRPAVIADARRRATNARVSVHAGARWNATEKLFPEFAKRAQEHWETR